MKRALLFVAALLAGCSAVPTHETLTSTMIEAPSTKALGARPWPARRTTSGTALGKDPFYLRGRGAVHATTLAVNSYIVNQTLNDYVNRVAMRLLKEWKLGTPPDLRVFIRTSGDYNAEALGDGDVFLSANVLRSIESEDELAFLLAHEISHVLLRHAEREDAIARTRATAGLASRAVLVGLYAASTKSVNITDTGVKTTADLRGAPGERMAMTTVAGMAIDKITETVIGGDWSRVQEAEADLLGTDLMVNAKYFIGANRAVTDQMKKAEDEQLRQAATKEEARQQAIAAVMQSGQIVSGAMQGVSGALKGLWDKLGDTHPSVEARRSWLDAYEKKNYDDLPRRNLETASVKALKARTKPIFDALDLSLESSAALVKGDINKAESLGTKAMNLAPAEPQVILNMALIRLARGQIPAAIKLLESATATGFPPIVAVVTLAQLHAASGRKDAAIATLDRARDNFGTDQPFLPTRISILRQFKDAPGLAAVRETCAKDPDRSTRKLCRQANDEPVADWDVQDLF